ncbi:hypothetical protein EXN66_Car013697 [Channa argus]|uniref:Uncharacterized protein n=1 Tax=Channa argus TaxID=215402 RepID=A0A6G1Q772_CHAAH|nr:hypothetical protein EXN66_Car013697 [Channa argus]
MHLYGQLTFTHFTVRRCLESTVTYWQMILPEEELATWHNEAKLILSQGWKLSIVTIQCSELPSAVLVSTLKSTKQ